MYSVGLHATTELLPTDRQGPVKPLKLTYLFDVQQDYEGTPYGNTEILEKALQISNQEYFIDTTQISYTELAKLIRTDYPEIDLEEELERLQAKALLEHTR